MRLSLIIPWRPGCAYRRAGWNRARTHLEIVLPDTELIVADDRGEPFSRAASINTGLEQATGDVIVVCDADLVVPAQQLHDGIRLAEQADGMVLPFDRYLYLTCEQTALIVTDPHLRLPHQPAYEWQMRGSVGGCNIVNRSTVEQTGGWPRGFRGWGFEDCAFNRSVETLVAPTRRVLGPLLHLWHPVDRTNRPDLGQYQANRNLDARYAAAEGDPTAMRALLDACSVR